MSVKPDPTEELIKLLSAMPQDKIKDIFQSLAEKGVRDDLRLLTRIGIVDQYNERTEDLQTYWGICVDAETTGLDKSSDEIIEISLIAFEFDQEGIIYNVKHIYSGFEEPTELITEEITKITGITNEDVSGKHFDDHLINNAFENAALVIAHNSAFDRPFFERRFPVTENNHWGCSYKNVDWDEEGIDIKKLGGLLAHYGFYFDAHRAEVDVRACIHLLTQTMESTGETALVGLLDAVRTPTYHIFALDAPFSKKDALKDRGYSWFPGESSKPKCWNKEIEEVEMEDELIFLRGEVYPGKSKDPFAVESVGSLNRYSERGGEAVTFNREAKKGNHIDSSDEFNQDPGATGLKGMTR